MALRPVVVGYQKLWTLSSRAEAETQLLSIRACADRQGFTLGTTYAETGADFRALHQALRVIERGEAHGLVVADERDLSDVPRARNFIRGMIAKSGGRLLIAGDAAVDGGTQEQDWGLDAVASRGRLDLDISRGHTPATGTGDGVDPLVNGIADPIGASMSAAGLMGLFPGRIPHVRRPVAGS